MSEKTVSVLAADALPLELPWAILGALSLGWMGMLGIVGNRWAVLSFGKTSLLVTMGLLGKFELGSNLNDFDLGLSKTLVM
jgi:hypothetical protein